MELRIRLSQPVFVVPSETHLYKDETVDLPPAYCLASCSSSASSSSYSASTSSPTSSYQQTLSVLITLSVPSTQASRHVLTSLDTKLVASESLAYNNGGFEQSFPIDIDHRVPLPQQIDLEPGQTYEFQADIPYPSHLPPSVQLPDARLVYKVRAKAKVQPTSCKDSWLGAILPCKTLSAQTGLTVLQAAETEPDLFSTIKYVSIRGLGSTCISMTPSPCVMGENTLLCLTLPDAKAKSKVASLQLRLVQDSYICSRHRAVEASSRNYKPRKMFELERVPSQTSDPTVLVGEKGRSLLNASSRFEAEFRIPEHADVQPSTLFGSSAVIHVSHHLHLTVRYSDSEGPDTEPNQSYTCSWPITLSRPEAVSRRVTDDLPPYTSADLQLKAHSHRLPAAPSFDSVSIV